MRDRINIERAKDIGPTGRTIPEGENLKDTFEKVRNSSIKYKEYQYYILKKNGKEVRITEETTFEEVERA